MKKKRIEFDFVQKSNNNNIFEYPTRNKNQNNHMDKWSKADSILQKSHIDNCFQGDTISTLNLGNLKSTEWDDIKIIHSHKKDDNILQNSDLNELDNKSEVENNNIYLEHLIHPIDDEFENFIQNKIEDLEKLKARKINNNNIKNRINKIYIDNNIINNNINKDNNDQDNISNYNITLTEEKNENEEKSVIRDKNDVFTFNKNSAENRKNDNSNNNNNNKIKTKSFLVDYNNYNDTENSIIKNNNKVYNNNNKIGTQNKIRLNNLLNKMKSDKKEAEIINKPNKFKLFDNKEENINLNKIQRRYYQQFREEEKIKDRDNDSSKDYFSSILYELNKGK